MDLPRRYRDNCLQGRIDIWRFSIRPAFIDSHVDLSTDRRTTNKGCCMHRVLEILTAADRHCAACRAENGSKWVSLAPLERRVRCMV